MAKKVKYDDETIMKVMEDYLFSEMTVTEIGKKHKITKNQVSYIVYVRSKERGIGPEAVKGYAEVVQYNDSYEKAARRVDNIVRETDGILARIKRLLKRLGLA